ncbi:LLM class F420-dependent oxidoreductase [Pseudonocardia eucalypti]|uniref:LLM class F420-dependent oxidoreductase n=1 Tax=Pseudonocardia eucalypti TaxID=648755 RepID=A0ABP9PPP6_9PSEU|nr:putative F420-dependent oxidoreductase [Pseudonocardia eucalypti]
MLTLGKYGAWLNPVDDDVARTEYAVEAEFLGYGTVWLGLGLRDESDLRVVERVLDATSHVVVATAIINMWTNDPVALATSYCRLQDRHPDRFLLGTGVGHPESITGYSSPYRRMESFLEALDAGGVPSDRRVLAALGPRALRLAADRAAGSHPYLAVPAHTRTARRLLGPGALLAPEQTVVLDTDRASARARGRAFLSDPYLRLSNYVNNLLRHGYDETDVVDDGSDRLIDDLVLHGNADTIAAGVDAHLAAGADHVAIQVLPTAGQGPMPGLRALANRLIP